MRGPAPSTLPSNLRNLDSIHVEERLVVLDKKQSRGAVAAFVLEVGWGGRRLQGRGNGGGHAIWG